ncbi:MAG: hypothetical protein Tsb007_37540 [Rhizobacter sp.]
MTAVSTSTKLLLTLSAIKGVGPAALKKISALPNYWDLDLVKLSDAVPQIARAIEGQESERVWEQAQLWADQQLAAAEKYGARILSPADAEYPRLLADTKDDPFLLFVKGKLAAEGQQSVAIIGTREPTLHGVMIAKRITHFFVERRWSIVSGLALGCDAIAHQATLDSGGHTVAVLAHGLQMISPSKHSELARQILDAGGALVSEYPFGRTVLGAQFVKRDRTQAGMSQGVVMVQSDIKGGSLHASRAALDYRRWLAVPYPTDRDRDNEEPKVQANLVIADGTDAERANLLRCPSSALRLVTVVRGREDYLRLVDEEPSERLEAAQTIPDSPVEVDQPKKEARGRLTVPSDEAAAPQDADVEEGVLVPSAASVGPVGDVAPVEEQQVASAPEMAATNYYLEVGPEDLANLKTARLRVESSELAAGDSHDVFGMDVVVTLSRLGHLQSKLDELRKAYNSKRPIEGQRALRFRFQVEDVLTQMKFATEQLIDMDRGAHRQLLTSILVRHDAANGQSELPLSGNREKRQHDAPLVEVLDFLVGALPRSVSVRGLGVDSWVPSRSPCVEVHLSDLLLSFNDLIRAALPQGSYRITTALDAHQ